MDKALRAVVAARYAKCVSRVIYRLRRTPSEGMFGDDSPAQTLWDLWKWEMQEEHSLGHDVIEGMVVEQVEWLVESLPHEEGVLLTLGSDAMFELDENSGPIFDSRAVVKEILHAVNSRAINEPHRKEVQRMLGRQVSDRFERDMEPYRS